MSSPGASEVALPEFNLEGKVAVVTGGSGSIGAATAAALSGQGAAVAIVGRTPKALKEVAAKLSVGGRTVLPVRADCTSEPEMQELAGEVTARLGPADILCTFAGGDGMPLPTHEETAAHWRRVTDSELTSTFATIRAFLPAMLERHSGTIVTMASSAARQAAGSSAAYAAAKAGVIALSRHLAGEYARQGIRVNCLAPSAVENERMRRWMSEEERRALGGAFPLGRLGQPEDVAAATVFLASSASSWITGLTLDISGGKVML